MRQGQDRGEADKGGEGEGWDLQGVAAQRVLGSPPQLSRCQTPHSLGTGPSSADPWQQ